MMLQWNGKLLLEQSRIVFILVWFFLGLPSMLWFGIIQFWPFVTWLQIEAIDWCVLAAAFTIYLLFWLQERGAIK